MKGCILGAGMKQVRGKKNAPATSWRKEAQEGMHRHVRASQRELARAPPVGSYTRGKGKTKHKGRGRKCRNREKTGGANR